MKVKGIRRRVLPDLDDEFAKDVGAFDSLSALRDRVRADLEEEARDNARRHVRSDLFRQLSQRIPFEVPTSLVDREMDRRLEEFARQLMTQNVDPRQAGIDWAAIPRSSTRAGPERRGQCARPGRNRPAGTDYGYARRCR